MWGEKGNVKKPKSDPDTITQMRHKGIKEMKEKTPEKESEKEKEILLSLYPPMLYPTIRLLDAGRTGPRITRTERESNKSKSGRGPTSRAQVVDRTK